MKARPSRPSPDSRGHVIAQQRQIDRSARDTAPVVKTSAKRRAELGALLREIPGAGMAAQEDRLLLALQSGAVSTLDARNLLDIMSPAARVLALRRLGHQIAARWVRQATAAAGMVHTVCAYELTEPSEAA